ncbi:MAG: hypothetical protein KGY99_02680 [Phycisphaerae bacterium]|nr:hypothetical protein [Phycisphaerae bacterium]
MPSPGERASVALIATIVAATCSGCPPLRFYQYGQSTAYLEQLNDVEMQYRRDRGPLDDKELQRFIAGYEAVLYLDSEAANRAWELRHPPDVPGDARRAHGVGVFEIDRLRAMRAVTRLYAERGDWDGLLAFIDDNHELLAHPSGQYQMRAFTEALTTAHLRGPDRQAVADAAKRLSRAAERYHTPRTSGEHPSPTWSMLQRLTDPTPLKNRNELIERLKRQKPLL